MEEETKSRGDPRMGEGGDPRTKNKKGKFLFQFLKRCFHSLIIGYFQNKSRTKRGEREGRKMKWHRRGGIRDPRIKTEQVSKTREDCDVEGEEERLREVIARMCGWESASHMN
jgi:hypothetical protein